MLKAILEAYQLSNHSTIAPIGNGLINKTYQLITPENEIYILQKINDRVFRQPEAIENNIREIAAYLKTNYPGYLFPVPLPLPDGKQMLHIESNGYYRIFPFVKNSHSKNILTKPEQAFDAAAAFGKLTRLLNDFDYRKLQVTIPDFHNLNLRYTQFEQAVNLGNPKRIKEAKKEIEFLQAQNEIVTNYNKLLQHPDFHLRVAHHDAKISNVLFDQHDQVLCVIDFDTLMPGYFISDLGDMMRTYLCPVSEEETDYSKIKVRNEYYQAITKGFISETESILTDTEKYPFHFAGCYMIYMQALRFLTDYLNNDIYYGARYEKHNYNRAKNQIILLQKYMEL